MMFRLSEEQRAVLGNVRKLAQSEFRARALQYMDGSFPWENIRRLADLGILGMAVPPEYGGSGMGVLDTALVLEEIAKACYVTAMAVLGGEVAERAGHTGDALQFYQSAADSWDRMASAQGKLREISLQQSLGKLKRDDAVNSLETLTTIWRGDETEVEAFQGC